MKSEDRPKDDGIRILVVEDSHTQALYLQHLLEDKGYQVATATTGKEAMEHLRKEKPALVLSDVVMPEMDGFELTRAIKNGPDFQDIPVILLTALSDSEDVFRGLEAEVNFYLTKPYNDDFLISKIESVISSDCTTKSEKRPQELNVSLWGKTRVVNVDPERSLSFLASTYENAIQINRELQAEISERKRVEVELRSTLKRLKEMESIIEISPAVAFIRLAKDNWPIEFVSDNVLQFDYESEDLLSGQVDYGDIIHPEDRDRIFAEVAQYSEHVDVEEFSQEYRIRTGYGDTRWVDDRTFVRRNSKGVATHLQGIILDVTDRKS